MKKPDLPPDLVSGALSTLLNGDSSPLQGWLLVSSVSLLYPAHSPLFKKVCIPVIIQKKYNMIWAQLTKLSSRGPSFALGVSLNDKAITSSRVNGKVLIMFYLLIVK